MLSARRLAAARAGQAVRLAATRSGPAALALVLVTSWVTGLAQAQVFRDPLVSFRPVKVIVPSRGMPLLLSRGTITFLGPGRIPTLSITVGSLTLRPIQISGITLRVALGPTPAGMITFRMRPVAEDRDAPSLLPPARLTTGDAAMPLNFALALEDHAPPATAVRRDTIVVVTVERIEGDEGQLIFENPDASELLWEALGRPSFNSQ